MSATWSSVTTGMGACGTITSNDSRRVSADSCPIAMSPINVVCSQRLILWPLYLVHATLHRPGLQTFPPGVRVRSNIFRANDSFLECRPFGNRVFRKNGLPRSHQPRFQSIPACSSTPANETTIAHRSLFSVGWCARRHAGGELHPALLEGP